MTSIYDARIVGFDYIRMQYSEPVAVLWPCGAYTEFNETKRNPQTNLWSIGEAIAHHLDSCQECTLVNTQP